MPEKTPSPAEPVSALRAVRIIECGEEMVDFLEFCPDLIWDKPHFNYRRETVMRKTFAEKLCAAAAALPAKYKMVIIEGWRPPHIQRRMYQAIWNRNAETHPDWSHARMVRHVNRHSAPMNKRVPPPHTTGGAADLMLADAKGRVLNHSAPFEPFDPRSFSTNAEGISPEAKELRQIMAEALTAQGITNYPSEYWHWCYGDQGWAYRGGHPNAIYGAVEPPGWKPAPEDDIDEPLKFLHS